MMDHNPPPMINNHPCEKQRNGVDKFRVEHEADYETREKEQSRRDGIKQLEKYTSTYPKLREELKRRRSTARVTTPNLGIVIRSRPPSQKLFDRNCSHCQMAVESKQSRRKSRNARSKRRKSSKRSRVTKPKRNQRYKLKSNFEFVKVRPLKGCQYYSQLFDKGTSTQHLANEDKLLSVTAPALSSKSHVDSRNSGTSACSLSIQDSDMSLDHEPMVSP